MILWKPGGFLAGSLTGISTAFRGYYKKNKMMNDERKIRNPKSETNPNDQNSNNRNKNHRRRRENFLVDKSCVPLYH
jgi:CRISPR/Cas system-associated protein Cas5 (RAMP superfamily)